jgi:hypothetical protein
MIEHRRQLFQRAPVQSCFAIIAACMVLAALILYYVGGFKGYEARGFLPHPADSRGYVSVDYVMAEDTGLRVNDLIRWRSLDLATRLVFVQYRWVTPGKPIVYPVQRGNEQIEITRIPETDPSGANWPQSSGNPVPLFVLQLFVAVVILVVGTLLVLLRPSKVTWAWFFLSLWIAASVYSFKRGLALVAAFSSLPPMLHLVVSELFNLLQPAAYFGLLVFALYFPNRRPLGLLGVIDRLIPYVLVVVALLYLSFDLLALSCFCAPSWLERTIISFDTAVPILALAIAVVAYVRSHGVERQKIQWIAAAIALALVPYVVPYIVLITGFGSRRNAPVAFNNWYSVVHIEHWIVLLYIAPPLALAYTILRHRIYDIRFLLGRAIVLTILTSLVVVVFALIDWIFVRKLEQTGLGVIAGIAAVTTLGFTANAMHRRVDTFVDKALFRRRYLAQGRLARLARDLPNVRSLEALNALLVTEPYDAFNLTSAAIFRRGDGDSFTREYASGWPDRSLRALRSDKPPLAPLIDLRETARIRWRDPDKTEFPSTDAYPVLALPVNVRGRLEAIALYGPHKDGLDFDPDEIGAINGLMIPAAAAYDHLEAQQLRHEMETMRAELDRLRGSNPATDLPPGATDARGTEN